MNVTFDGARELLENFDFGAFFVTKLGWGDPTMDKDWQSFEIGDEQFARRVIAALDTVLVVEVRPENGRIPDANRRIEILDRIMKTPRGALVIFLNDVPGRARLSLWCWSLRHQGRDIPRFHLFIKGEPIESLLTKLEVIHADLGGADERANVRLFEISNLLKKKLDKEKLLAQFFAEFQSLHTLVMDDVRAWPKKRDKYWFASVFLARFIVTYILLKSGHVFDDCEFVEKQLKQLKESGNGEFYDVVSRKIFADLFPPHSLEDTHPDSSISNRTFNEILAVISRYQWHLVNPDQGDEPGIDIDILGAVFEAHMNDRDSGAIHTPPLLVNYLCEQTIQFAVLEHLRKFDDSSHFSSFDELLLQMNEQTATRLLNDILPSIHILDPACGSGAYLQAAMNSLFRIYLGASVKTDHDDETMETIRRRIVTNNLCGVDIAEEAVELTQLRLWLALIAAQKTKKPIAPMSALKCRIYCGNSLFGSLKKAAKSSELDQELVNEFKQLCIKYENRDIGLDDIRAERPFYWGLVFDEIINQFGGFDAIVTNPPWTSFRFDEREFLKESDVVHRRKLDMENIPGARLLEDMEIDTEYRDRRARMALMRAYYAQAREFPHARHYSRFSYELFVERIFTLLRDGGKAGVLVPSGLLSDSATRDLRKLILDEGDLRILLGISNRNHIFATLHPMFESCLMIFGKGRVTGEFKASFNVKDPGWLDVHLATQGFLVCMNGDLVREMSPRELAIIEFRNGNDIAIARRMRKFPPLEELIDLRIGYSFGGQDKQSVPDWLQGVPVYDGRNISQYACEPEVTKQTVEKAVRRIRGKPEDLNTYRLVCRSIGSRTNIRSMIATVVPRNVVCTDKLLVEVPGSLHAWSRFYLLALLNSFVIDYWIRQRMHRWIYLADVYDVPVPRLDWADASLRSLALRAAKLVCIGPEFDELAREIGLRDHSDGIRDRFSRERVRAEIDGLVAHLFGLSESELLQVMGTFPQVPDPEKIAVHNAYRDAEKGILR